MVPWFTLILLLFNGERIGFYYTFLDVLVENNFCLPFVTRKTFTAVQS